MLFPVRSLVCSSVGEDTSFSGPTKKVPEFSQLMKQTGSKSLKVKESEASSSQSTEEPHQEAQTNPTQGKKKKKLFDHEVK